MTPPNSRIFFGDKEIINKERTSRNTFYVFSDGTKITASRLGKIKIECQECQELKEISLYYGIYEKNYSCQGCTKKGEKNPFYGKLHSQEFKDRLSRERKGTWCIGTENGMFGRRIQDFVTPEKFEEMREKNRQHALNRVDNPFRKSMREVIGDERFEEAIRKTVATRASWSEQTKLEYSRKISESQKRLAAADPEGYREKKSRGGIVTASKPTSYKMNNLEKKVADWLTENDIRHTYSPIMSNGERNLQYDFLLHDYRILLECHGTYWHGDPRFFAAAEPTETQRKLNETQIRNINKDKLKKKFAQNKDFKLVILWEHDVNNNNYKTLKKELDKK